MSLEKIFGNEYQSALDIFNLEKNFSLADLYFSHKKRLQFIKKSNKIKSRLPSLDRALDFLLKTDNLISKKDALNYISYKNQDIDMAYLDNLSALKKKKNLGKTKDILHKYFYDFDFSSQIKDDFAVFKSKKRKSAYNKTAFNNFLNKEGKTAYAFVLRSALGRIKYDFLIEFLNENN